MAKTHLLSCLHDGCNHVLIVAAGELPQKCEVCQRTGMWQIDRVMMWTVEDLRVLRGLHIAAD